MNNSIPPGIGSRWMCGWLVFVVFCSQVPLVNAAGRSRAPNIILILIDDLGWRDVGFLGHQFVDTPHIDRLARQGMVFTHAYASAPNCAPTRACLMSGQYTPRHGIYTVVVPRQPPGSAWHKLLAAESKSDLDTNIVTIAETLKTGGYSTGFFGMWNLGRGRSGPTTPSGQGFEKVVFPENLRFAKDAYVNEHNEYLSDRLTDEVLSFVEGNRNRTFFAYFADHAVHAPYDPKPDLLKKYERKAAAGSDRRNNAAYAATIEAIDQNVGRIMDQLDKLKLTENTVVIFTSDNGGTSQFTAPLHGSKGELYEGGIRVPLVISCPGLKNPGSRCDAAVTSVDLYPTLLELAGIALPKDQILDGVSLVKMLDGETSLSRERMFWHFPCYVGKATPCSAVREGDFKLIEFFEDGGRNELYNLRFDPLEEHNLATEMPEKLASLAHLLRTWRRLTHAALPEGPNPNYDPNVDRPRGRANEPKGNSRKGMRLP